MKYDAAKLTTSAMVDAVGETGMRMWLEHEEPMLGGAALEWRWKLMLACGGLLAVAALLDAAGLPRAALPFYLAGAVGGHRLPAATCRDRRAVSHRSTSTS